MNLDLVGECMIRSELVHQLCEDFPDLTQREIESVVTALFDSITDSSLRVAG